MSNFVLKIVGKYIILGALCGIFALAVCLSIYQVNLRKYSPSAEYVSLLDEVENSIVGVSGITSRTEAQKKGMLWFGDANLRHFNNGVAIDLTLDAKIFNEVFPGYADSLRLDDSFWKPYAMGIGTAESFIPYFPNATKQGLAVLLNWIGCLEIYARYGADIITVGNSESIPQVVQSQLSKNLFDRFGGSPPKILACSLPGIEPVGVQEFATALKKLRPDLQLPIFIWSYSFWYFAKESNGRAIFRKKTTDYLNSFDRAIFNEAKSSKKWDSIQLESLKDLLPNVVWTNIWHDHVTLTGLLRAKSVRENSSGHFELPTEFIDPVRNDLIQKLDLKTDEEFNAALNKHVSLKRNLLENASREDCYNTLVAEEALDGAINKIQNLARDVYIYLSPVTSFQMQAGPDCLLNTAIQKLKARSSKRVHIKTSLMADYGLTYRDYLYQTQDPNVYFFEVSHVNPLLGGVKITRHLADWISDTYK